MISDCKISFFVNKVSHYVQITLFSCYVQGCFLMKIEKSTNWF